MAVNGDDTHEDPVDNDYMGNYTTSVNAKDKDECAVDRWTANEGRGMQNEAVAVNHVHISVVAIVGKKEKNLIVRDIALAQGGGEITFDRAHRISSIERHHLEKFDAMGCESATAVNVDAGRLTCPCPA